MAQVEQVIVRRWGPGGARQVEQFEVRRWALGPDWVKTSWRGWEWWCIRDFYLNGEEVILWQWEQGWGWAEDGTWYVKERLGERTGWIWICDRTGIVVEG